MNDPKRIVIVLLGLIFLGVCAYGVKGHLDSEGYKNQVAYTTAIRSTEKDSFNYIVDSQQGRVLAHGTFTAEAERLAKFDEMTKGFSHVKRTKEHYTQHESRSCDEDGSCTTHTYYTWDTVAEDEQYTASMTFMERKYTPTMFNFEKFDKDLEDCSFIPVEPEPEGLAGLFVKKGCHDGDYYLSHDDRYSYKAAPVSFDATIMATTYGGLKPHKGNTILLEDKSIDQILVDVGKYQLYSFWTFIFILLALTAGAMYGAYQWVMMDEEWSLYY